jgi:hypothetical protein
MKTRAGDGVDESAVGIIVGFLEIVDLNQGGRFEI